LGCTRGGAKCGDGFKLTPPSSSNVLRAAASHARLVRFKVQKFSSMALILAIG
jgi:hypothetical protein